LGNLAAWLALLGDSTTVEADLPALVRLPVESSSVGDKDASPPTLRRRKR
jgi:hypothetical protein